jgi:denticleless
LSKNLHFCISQKSQHLSSSPAVPSGSVTAIKFQDEHTLISSSDSDGIIKVWDMRKSYDRYSRQPQPKYQFPYAGKSALKGYTALALNSTKTQLFASCKDHAVYKFDAAGYSEKPLAAYTGFENNSKYFCRISLSHGETLCTSEISRPGANPTTSEFTTTTHAL